MQADGNFVCYQGCPSTLGASSSYWSTGTSVGTSGLIPSLKLQDDGNLVLYQNPTSNPTQNNNALWASDTGGNVMKELRLQDDRRLVLSRLTLVDSTTSTVSDVSCAKLSMTAVSTNTAIPTPVPTPVPTVAWAPSPPTLKPSSACVYYTGWTWRPPLGSEVSEFY